MSILCRHRPCHRLCSPLLWDGGDEEGVKWVGEWDIVERYLFTLVPLAPLCRVRLFLACRPALLCGIKALGMSYMQRHNALACHTSSAKGSSDFSALRTSLPYLALLKNWSWCLQDLPCQCSKLQPLWGLRLHWARSDGAYTSIIPAGFCRGYASVRPPIEMGPRPPTVDSSVVALCSRPPIKWHIGNCTPKISVSMLVATATIGTEPPSYVEVMGTAPPYSHWT
jgi:hypothetical protein